MANELTVTVSAQLSRGNGDKVSFAPGAKRINVTGTRKSIGTQQLSTVAEVLAVGEVASGGWAWFHNLDNAASISLGLDNDADPAFAILKPGEAFALRLASQVVYAKASAGTPLLSYGILED